MIDVSSVFSKKNIGFVLLVLMIFGAGFLFWKSTTKQQATLLTSEKEPLKQQTQNKKKHPPNLSETRQIQAAISQTAVSDLNTEIKNESEPHRLGFEPLVRPRLSKTEQEKMVSQQKQLAKKLEQIGEILNQNLHEKDERLEIQKKYTALTEEYNQLAIQSFYQNK